MKKIGLYLSAGPHSGGSFQYCLAVVKSLKFLDKKKYRIITFITNKIWRKYLPKEFVVIEIKKNNKVDKYLNYLKFIIFSKKLYKYFCNLLSRKINLLNRHKCDLIIFPAQEEFSSKIFTKSISVIHDLMHRYEPQFKEYSYIEKLRRDFLYKKICNNSFAVLVDSEIGKKHVIESYKIDKKKIFICQFEVPEYLKLSKITNIFKKYNVPKKKFIFYPAQFWQHKNHINLIRAFSLFREKITNVNLVLIGVDKNNLSEIKKEIYKFNLEKSVFILGYVKNKDIFSFYKKASLLSYVTYCGPTNIPPLEAMYTGCPMICSNVYGMPKQVNKSALMINPKSYRDIYKKMILLFSNNKIKKRLVQKGYETLNKNKNQNIKKIIEKLNF